VYKILNRKKRKHCSDQCAYTSSYGVKSWILGSYISTNATVNIVCCGKTPLYCWCLFSSLVLSRVSQPGFRETLGSARDLDWKNKHRFLNLLAKINRSTKKYHSLLKIALTIIIGLLYLQLTDRANVPLQGYRYRGSLRPENYFKGSFRVKRLRKAGLECRFCVMCPYWLSCTLWKRCSSVCITNDVRN
jgi:hypothetical protein